MFYREAGVFKTSYAADMALMPLPNTRWAAVALGVLFIGIAPLVCDDYSLSILNLILIAVVGAIGLNILVGYTDQVSIGHGAFMSVGAYTAAHLITKLDAPFWIAVPAGGLMAAADRRAGRNSLAAHQGPVSRDRHAGGAAHHRMDDQPRLVGVRRHAGDRSRCAPPSVFGTQLTSAWQMYLFLMFFVILAIVGTQNLIRSRIGRAFIAIRDQDIAAEIIGINIFRYKLWAFAISSFYAGVTGVLYTYYLGIANYEQFQLDVSINFLAMVIIGGLGSTLGPIFGAIFVTLLPIVTRRVLEVERRPVLRGVRSVGGDPQPAARHLRRADHLLSGRRAGRPEPALAQHPELLPGVAILVLNQAATRESQDATSDGNDPDARGMRDGGSVVRRRRGGAAEGDPDRLPVRPHRPDADHRHGVLSGGAGLRQPDQLEGRHRRLQDPRRRARQQLPGAGGDRGL